MSAEELERELAATKKGERVTLQQVRESISCESYYYDGTLTICVLTLRNGFKVTGESACADPKNYDPDLGRRLAKDSAMDKIWALEGYLLRQRLYDRAQMVPVGNTPS